MKKQGLHFKMLLSALAASCFAIAPIASAVPLLINGGFELGFTGWTVTDQAGSGGTWLIQSGTGSPINGFPVQPPPEGNFAAMTDQVNGPGTHILYQDFIVPTGTIGSATGSFQLYLNNQADDYFTPPTLDYTAIENQQFRADIITTSADVFSVAPGDVLQNLYITMPGDPLEAGYFLVPANLTALFQAHQGETLRLRFAEVDNQFFFNAGVDAVSIDATADNGNGNGNDVPEPASLALLLIGLAGVAAMRRRGACNIAASTPAA
ncbi:MAG: PEP-CTERM sorting domain-containing protein [Pseudomonadota bacterium]